MKRELLENVKVQPYTSGDAIDRDCLLYTSDAADD